MHGTTRKPTLKQIAERLGVSKATVSNAFNRPDQLSAALRERILGECERLGYTGPSITARSLRTGRTRVIGVLLADSLAYNFTDPVASQFLEGIAVTLDRHHVNMLLLPTCEENYQSTQVETIPDGFIVYGQPAADSLLARLSRQGKPMVTVDFNTDLAHCVSVNIDNRAAAHDIASHALRGLSERQPGSPKGSKDARIAVLGLKLSPAEQPGVADLSQLYSYDSSISRRRLEGYRDAITEAGLELSADSIWHLPWQDHHQIRVLARGVLSAPERPNVLLCMSDKIALAALAAARDLSIPVPDALRIVGFDNIPAAEQAGLTTVHQPLRAKGQRAAELLLEQREFAAVIEPTELKLRASAP